MTTLKEAMDKLPTARRQKVEAMGGKLSLIAQFPDRPPVVLTGIAALDEKSPAAKTLDSA
ncbi:MAG: hypothetical protein F4Y08_13635 [Caldilineaceae bacterium SB0662_bin_9]|uniref:Uncharacterized protein n=1 Tax=Caldilineaceae bacterium SB0662_bin_9 TaxID=2605258 RepID=A0A6B1DX51_9CHLR|nr:hypothetical protein [Caldilineaceae bacterium SB0662_bin_9]